MKISGQRIRLKIDSQQKLANLFLNPRRMSACKEVVVSDMGPGHAYASEYPPVVRSYIPAHN